VEQVQLQPKGAVAVGVAAVILAQVDKVALIYLTAQMAQVEQEVVVLPEQVEAAAVLAS
jgi:hypothetical protein